MGFNLKKLLKNDTVKMGLAAGGGFLLGKYAPDIKSKITDIRKVVQAKRNTLFPNYGKSASEAAGPAQMDMSGGGMVPAAMSVGYQGGGEKGFFDRLLDLIFGTGR